jgi:uncharacterized protein YqjF (DUF2071 family)
MGGPLASTTLAPNRCGHTVAGVSSERPEPAPVQSEVPPVDAIAPPLTSPPIMNQQWCCLAFLHWFVPPARVQSWMPPGATPDIVPSGPFAGLTPVALVPFRMVDAGFGPGPAVPYFGTFWETNVRLYSIDATGTHGIVFCSLDASRLAVVLAARLTLGLPYRFSRMRGYDRIHDGAREVAWTARTRWPGPRGTSSRIAIRVDGQLPGATREQPADEHPTGSEINSAASSEASRENDSLVTFLTARWGLHTTVWGRTMYVPNVHQTWTLRSAEVLLLDDGLLRAAGFGDLATRPTDHVCFAEGVHTRFGLPRVLDTG